MGRDPGSWVVVVPVGNAHRHQSRLLDSGLALQGCLLSDSFFNKLLAILGDGKQIVDTDVPRFRCWLNLTAFRMIDGCKVANSIQFLNELLGANAVLF